MVLPQDTVFATPSTLWIAFCWLIIATVPLVVENHGINVSLGTRLCTRVSYFAGSSEDRYLGRFERPWFVRYGHTYIQHDFRVVIKYCPCTQVFHFLCSFRLCTVVQLFAHSDTVGFLLGGRSQEVLQSTRVSICASCTVTSTWSIFQKLRRSGEEKELGLD